MNDLYNFVAGLGQARQGSARSGLARFGEVGLALFWRGAVWSGMVRYGRVRRGSLRLCLVWLLCGGLQAAEITLTVDPPLSPVSSYRIYVGLSPNSYFTFQSFPETNRFTFSVTNNNRIYLACSALNGASESDLSSEIVAMIFTGWVQAGPSISGPFSNYMSFAVAIEIKEPQVVLRSKLDVP